MLDIQYIRENAERVTQFAKDKNEPVDVAELLELDGKRRTLQSNVEDLNRRRNELAKAGGKGRPSAEAVAAGKKVKKELGAAEDQLAKIVGEYHQLMEALPNEPSEDTPVGKDESANEVLRQVGGKPDFSFEPKEHWQLGRDLDVIDSERAAKVTGARFVYLKGDLARLQFALVQYALSVLTDEKQLISIIKKAKLDVPATPFVPVIPPVFVKPGVMHKMDRLEPRDQRYHTAADDLYLVGSAEHTLGPMHMDEVLQPEQLPLRYVGYSTSFRREAGTYGKDTRGILRQHQFDKVEMESLTAAEGGRAEHELYVAIQEHLMGSLGLPYQVVLKCTADQGKPNHRGVDIETWMPGQGKYRETHSADYMTDYQARRLGTKVKTGRGNQLVHTNDGTAYAIGRTLIAIMENGQRADGSIDVPRVLRPFVGGLKKIERR